MSDPLILVGDIGGTNARFACARQRGDSFALRDVATLQVADFQSAEAAIENYLGSLQTRPAIACFAVAGPVTQGAGQLTNGAWRFNAASLGARFGFARARLVNDFAAQARGAVLVPKSALREIAPGRAVAGAPIVVLGPGTGLGLAALVPGAHGPLVIAGEGGHAAFAPCDAYEDEIVSVLRTHLGYVSFEAVSSGRGIEHVWRALQAASGARDEGLTAAQIARLADTNPLAARALGVFFSALGTFAGDMALAFGAKGGVFLGGGILPKQAERLVESKFVTRFRARGPMSAYLAEVPVHLILTGETALLGAAAFATQADHT